MFKNEQELILNPALSPKKKKKFKNEVEIVFINFRLNEKV